MNETDVLIIGGSFSGAAAALLLRREAPHLSITIVERSEKFDRKVGEALTEISGAFLTKRLGLTHHLNHHHIVKNGLRFWFVANDETTFETAGELGASINVQLPTYQVDREVLDRYLLGLAVTSGATLLRPAQVKDWKTEAGRQLLTVESETGTQEISARWVLDASGKAAWIARRKRFLRPVEDHPINAIWARFHHVADFDCWEWRKRFPMYAKSVQVSRTSATNHLTGYGWWCWLIPLKGGDTSVGLVYDERIYTPPEGANLGERLLTHLRTHPLGRELFAAAEVVPGDVKAYSPLPYYSEKIAGPGWQIAGDAVGFMDPLYSAGLDYASWTISAAVNRIKAEDAGTPIDCDAINRDFQKSYHAWFSALYRQKYHYLADRPLMTAAYLMDLGLFFFGPVREVVGCVHKGFATLPFCGPVDSRVAKVMKFYNERLGSLGRQKMERGIFGKTNNNVRRLVPGFHPSPFVWRHILSGAALWLSEECKMLFLRLFHPIKKDT